MQILLDLHYLPCVQYMSKFLQYDAVVIEQHEHYSKGSYRNRCYLAAANDPLLLSIPLIKGKNQQQNIRHTRISYDTPWQRLHWRSIFSAYGNAPYFEYYADSLAPFYQKKYEYLFDFNLDLLQWVLACLDINTSWTLTKEYSAQPTPPLQDWRNAIHPKPQRRRKDIYFEATYYPQVFEDRHGFIGNLTILDLLFCAGTQAALILESCITTKHT
ncbi:MAG TPA: hypothetical protein ENJ45_03130 [Phaeodactylibacter sp.]|nr:hypothetical protein [Phaeodactylibacter sp.]